MNWINESFLDLSSVSNNKARMKEMRSLTVLKVRFIPAARIGDIILILRAFKSLLGFLSILSIMKDMKYIHMKLGSITPIVDKTAPENPAIL